MNDPLMEFVRNTTWPVFFGVIAIISALFLGLLGYFYFKVGPTKEDVCKEASFQAKRLAEHDYFVTKVRWRMSGAVLTLKTADSNRRRERLFVSGAHPDYSAAMALGLMERVRFTYSEMIQPGLSPEDEDAYLRLIT